MTLNTVIHNALKMVKSNSPEILTALGVSGVITTSYLAGKASFKAAELVADNENPNADEDRNRREIFLDRARYTWKLYIPTGISGVLTIGCIVGASKATGRRTAAAVTAYSLTERAFSEYREKVVEQIGKGKEQKIRDDIAQDHISENPPSGEVVIMGRGEVLCCELFTHRYFRSDMETLRKAQNDINALVISEMYVTLEEFYDMIGLPHTAISGDLGWSSEKLMELYFTTTLSEDNEPCLAFNYNYTRPLGCSDVFYQ